MNPAIDAGAFLMDGDHIMRGRIYKSRMAWTKPS